MSAAKIFQFGAKAAAIKETSMLKKKKSAKKKLAAKKKATASTEPAAKKKIGVEKKPPVKKKAANESIPETSTQSVKRGRAPKPSISGFITPEIEKPIPIEPDDEFWHDDDDGHDEEYYGSSKDKDDGDDDDANANANANADNDVDDDDDDDGYYAGSSKGNRYNHDGWWHYTPAAPIAVRGGIKARSSRGAFATNWWGKRWIDTLESFHIGARLARGKSYARSGQVSSLQIGSGNVRALVQGTRKTPYAITIRLRAFTPEEWTKILRKLRSEPIHAVRLLNGEMPEELEDLVKKTGVPLFPQRHADLVTDCSCPDYSNPCKHIAAAYYILAEALDADPFLLLRMRGMDRDQLMSMLKGPTSATVAPAPAFAPAPLPVDAAAYWDWTMDSSSHAPTNVPPQLHAALPRRLGAITFWRSDTPFIERMEQIYASASRDAIDWIPDEDGLE